MIRALPTCCDASACKKAGNAEKRVKEPDVRTLFKHEFFDWNHQEEAKKAKRANTAKGLWFLPLLPLLLVLLSLLRERAGAHSGISLLTSGLRQIMNCGFVACEPCYIPIMRKTQAKQLTLPGKKSFSRRQAALTVVIVRASGRNFIDQPAVTKTSASTPFRRLSFPLASDGGRLSLSHPHTFTRLLQAYRQGSSEAAERLFTLVYQDLRCLAQQYLNEERPGHTLQAMALVHEACLRLFGGSLVELEDRAHFFVVAARQMRRILIDYARTEQSEKRGGQQARASLAEAADVAVWRREELLALDEALSGLEQFAPRVSRAVGLRFFAGLTEAAQALRISPATIKRDRAFARVWLRRQMNDSLHEA
jgi:RNA polymerase sigma factor (TIGR02999 family)